MHWVTPLCAKEDFLPALIRRFLISKRCAAPALYWPSSASSLNLCSVFSAACRFNIGLLGLRKFGAEVTSACVFFMNSGCWRTRAALTRIMGNRGCLWREPGRRSASLWDFGKTNAWPYFLIEFSVVVIGECFNWAIENTILRTPPFTPVARDAKEIHSLTVVRGGDGERRYTKSCRNEGSLLCRAARSSSPSFESKLSRHSFMSWRSLDDSDDPVTSKKAVTITSFCDGYARSLEYQGASGWNVESCREGIKIGLRARLDESLCKIEEVV